MSRAGNDSLMEEVAAASGKVLAVAFGALGRIRPAAKPLHPRGVVSTARLRRFGASTGIAPWIDNVGDHQVLLRLSRGIGLPAGWPDVLGLAIRVPLDRGLHGDLLLASTGNGPLSRYALVPARDPYQTSYSTLLPYRTARGPAVIAAVRVQTEGDCSFELRAAIGRRPWSPSPS